MKRHVQDRFLVVVVVLVVGFFSGDIWPPQRVDTKNPDRSARLQERRERRKGVGGWGGEMNGRRRLAEWHS